MASSQSVERHSLDMSDLQTMKRKKSSRSKRLSSLSKADLKQHRLLASQCMVHPDQFPPLMWKYWKHRYQLFSMYDQGCLLDEQSWYSVTPECVAHRIAKRCATDNTVLDLFAGAGGNAIQFAFTCASVIAIEIDPIKIQLAKWNAKVYGVADRIQFIQADAIEVLQVLARSKASVRPEEDDAIVIDTLTRKDVQAIDVIFLSPPWGGIGYLAQPPIEHQATSLSTTALPPSHTQSETEVDDQINVQAPLSPTPQLSPPLEAPHFYSLSSIVPIPGTELFESCLSLTSNIAFYLPRNTNLNELSHLSTLVRSSSDPQTAVKVEEQWLGPGKFSSITAYFGQLASSWDNETDNWRPTATKEAPTHVIA